ncbi:Zn-dependent oligopeptidase [Candidatus Dependentiae bacterium]|nr:Zn-dependent oligopeptidase [Candidatus Dependentiae bacterium]
MVNRSEAEFIPAVTATADIVPLFPTTVAQVEARVARAEQKVKEGVDRLLAIPAAERTFANTAKALDIIGYNLGKEENPIAALKELTPNRELSEACEKALLTLHAYTQEHLTKNVAVYQAFKEYVTGNATKEKLNAEQQYYLQEVMKGFKLSGLELPAEQLQRVKKLNTTIAELSLQFSGNIANDTTKVALTKQELSGVAQRVLDGLQRDNEGKLIAGVDFATYIAIMETCSVSATRKKMFIAYTNRAYPANQAVLEELIRARHELANILGFKTYAAFELYDQMIETPERAYAFIDSFVVKARKKLAAELELITKELPAGVERTAEQTINEWDWRYIKAAYKKKHLALDKDAIAEYFPVDHVISSIFSIYQQFLNLRFERIAVAGFWHPDVIVTAVYDRPTNALRGYLLLDLHPREKKYSHACMMSIIPAMHMANDNLAPAVIAVIANFPKATKETPALLQFDDVNTFFHEFGHAMHGMVGATEMAEFSGTNVKRDFVEMPSQMFEEWLRDPHIVQLVSQHYQTGKSLPQNLINTLIEIDKFDAGDFYLRQMALGLTSLDYFNNGDHVDLLGIQQKNQQFTRPFLAVAAEDHSYANFGHLAGYGARYYGYLWSKVFAVDMANAVKQDGFLQATAGKKLIDLVLSKGGSKNPNLILRDFLGREPQQEAFLASLGF